MRIAVQHRRLRARDGERFSLLIHGTPGSPLFYPTVYMVELRRARGLAASTLWNDEEALKHLLVWANNAGIDLPARFVAGKFLSVTEVASYARAAKRLHRFLVGPGVRQRWHVRNPAGLESFRAEEPPPDSTVDLALEDHRLRTARAYLGWLADKTTPLEAASPAVLEARRMGKAEMLDRIKSYEPGAPSRSRLPREGLSDELQCLLKKVIHPSSPRNPWHQPYVRIRNQVLIHFLLGLGTRKGESQKQTVSNIDMCREEIAIVRNPDASDDLRRVEPNVKRAGRVLAMDSSLSDLLSDYITEWRSQLPGAARVDYLFLTVHGKPMSSESVHKVFTTLRLAIPELPANLSAHLLRHTWNDNYSVIMDENRVDSVREIRTRSYIMGWRETSGSARRYTERSTQRRANEHLKSMQRRTIGKE